jgi:hypothetical protein
MDLKAKNETIKSLYKMENMTTIADCVEFKNELHKKLYVKSGAKNFNEYIKYINSVYSDNGHAVVPGTAFA